MPGCAAVGCTNSAKKNFLMRKFPKDPARRKEWLIRMKRDQWTPTDYSCLCEVHFEPEMWERTREDGSRRLRLNAVPTIFAFSTPVKTRKQPKPRRNTVEVQPQTLASELALEPQPSTSQPKTQASLTVLGSCPTEVMEDPSDHQLVEDDLVQNLNLYDAKFLDFPMDADECEKLEKPYFRSIKSCLQDDNRMAEVCRICFRSLKEEEVIKLYEESLEQDSAQIKNLINLVLPDLDLEIYSNNAICVKCAELLMYSYQLKEKWLATEEKLQKIIAKQKGEVHQDADLVIIGKKVVHNIPLQTDHTYAKNPLSEEPPQPDTEVPQKSPLKPDDASTTNPLPQLGYSVVILENAPSEPRRKCLSKNVVPTDGNSDTDCLTARQRKRKEKKMMDLGPHLCDVCGSTCPNKISFKRHSQVHKRHEISNQESTHLCDLCGQIFKDLTSFKIHKRTHTETKCKICNGTFKNRGQLRCHIASEHRQNSHQCHLCGKQYHSLDYLRCHVKLHNPANRNKACHLCDKKFLFAARLKTHLLSAHVTEKLHKCDICGRRVKHKKSLETHIKVKHLNGGKYVCEFCERAFRHKCGLESHRRRIHGPLVEQNVGEGPKEEGVGNDVQQIQT